MNRQRNNQQAAWHDKKEVEIAVWNYNQRLSKSFDMAQEWLKCETKPIKIKGAKK